MTDKQKFSGLIFFVVSCFFAWGCAPKPVPVPDVSVPDTVQVPDKKVEPAPEQDLILILVREAEQFAGEGNYQDALLVYNQALDEALRRGFDGQAAQQIIVDRIEGVLSMTPPGDIQAFSRIKNLCIPQGLFLYWQGHNFAQRKDYPDAISALEQFLSLYPDHQRAPAVKTLLKTIQQAHFKKDTLGCILPLSGKYGVYGQKALKGIELAVRDMSRALGYELNVIVKDSAADPEQAAGCVKALARENVFAVLGPLLVPERAGQQAEALNIPMVAMTQKSDFPLGGQYLFSNFIMPEMQVEALGAYIFQELGLKQVAILYPREKYGRKYMGLFWDVVDKYQGEVVGAESYDGSKTDFSTALKKLSGQYYPVPEFIKQFEADRTRRLSGEGEAGLSFADMDADLQADGEAQDTAADLAADDADDDPVQIDFQALFIPDGLSRINLILPQLAFHDIRDVFLLGTNLWHRQSLLAQTKGYNKNAVICDGYFGASQNPVTAGFDRSFRALFQEAPGFLEAIAYDTASLLFKAASAPEAGSRQQIKDLLQGHLMFDGVTGQTIFDGDGRPHKKMFLITVKNGKFREILN